MEQNQLKELLGNVLPFRDAGDFDGFSGLLRGEVKDGQQGIITFGGNVHRYSRHREAAILLPARRNYAMPSNSTDVR